MKERRREVLASRKARPVGFLHPQKRYWQGWSAEGEGYDGSCVLQS